MYLILLNRQIYFNNSYSILIISSFQGQKIEKAPQMKGFSAIFY